MKAQITTLVTLLLLALPTISAASQPRALIYKGPGACEEACPESLAEIAKKDGLEPVFVSPEETDPKIFDGVVLWMQPGGQSSTAARAMAPALKQNLKRFISNGGGYVGFCAGGFLATSIIGDTKNEGLGILPGHSQLVDMKEDAAIMDVQWDGKPRKLYWEGGPYFYFDAGDPVEIRATYVDGTVAAVRASYGFGRVYVTGLHPEAPQFWRDYYKLNDTDGLDNDLVEEMIEWARIR